MGLLFLIFASLHLWTETRTGFTKGSRCGKCSPEIGRNQMAHKGVELCISMAKVGLPTWSRDNSVIESAAKDKTTCISKMIQHALALATGKRELTPW